MQRYSHGEIVVVVDCRDLALMASFWSAALGYRSVGGAEPYLGLLPLEGTSSLEVLLQRVPEEKQAKNRLHLDLRVVDLAAEVERLVQLGARVLTQAPLEEGGWIWHVLGDPEGNEFCVLQPPAVHWDE